MSAQTRNAFVIALITAGLTGLIRLADWRIAALVFAIGIVFAVVALTRDRAEAERQLRIVRPYFDALSLTEKLVLKELYAVGVMTDLGANELVGSEGLKAKDVLNGLKEKTPFVLKHFSGQFTANEPARRALESLLESVR